MIVLPDTGCVSILFSGGADSTILAYIVAKKYNHRNPRLFTLGSLPEKLARIHTIIDTIEHKTGYRYPLTVFKEHMFIRPSVEKILGVYPGVVITGCNKVVTDVFTPTVYLKGDTPPVRGPALNAQHLRPFIDMDKIAVIELYLEYGVLDLLALTRSCGMPTGVCGGCYFCMERAWACQVLDIADEWNK